MTASIPPGGSTPVEFKIYTLDAKPGTYKFGVKLVELHTTTGESSTLSVDKEHTFTVVES